MFDRSPAASTPVDPHNSHEVLSDVQSDLLSDHTVLKETGWFPGVKGTLRDYLTLTKPELTFLSILTAPRLLCLERRQ